MPWVTLDELKTDLRSRGESNGSVSFDDEQLQQVLDAAVAIVQRLRPEFGYPEVPEVGDLVPLTIKVLDADGTPVNATTVALTVSLPDGNSISLAVTNPPAETGIYGVDFPSTLAGAHVATWTTTGPAAAYAQSFTVLALTGRPAPPADLKLGTLRLAGRLHSRRRSPDGLVFAGDYGSSRIPAIDPDIERLLGIGRFRGPVFA